MSAVAESRDVAFARLAVAKRLVTKEHAEECVRVARDLAKRGKGVPVEEVFLKRGYLRKPEVQTLAKLIAKKPAEPKLELAPNVGATPDFKVRRKCPNCEKDPGHAEDECPRCGADLETGGPGPNATMCASCARVVKRGAAVCPRCAMPIERPARARRGGSGWLDRIVVLAAAAGCFYFLVYKNLQGQADAPVSSSGDGNAPARTPVDEALAKGDLESALRALEDARRAPEHDRRLDVAWVEACRKAGRLEAAQDGIARLRREQPEEPGLMVLAAAIAVDRGAVDEGAKLLDLVPEKDRQDGYWRERARLADRAKDERSALDHLAKVRTLTPAESRRLAQDALARANAAYDAENFEVARKHLERALTLSPDYAPARERLGVLLLAQRKPGEARVQFERATKLAPEDPAPWLGLAVACEQRGDAAAARAAYEKFLARARKDARYAREVKVVEERLNK